jgi:hypothetical protein
MEPISHPGLCKREAVANDAPAREAALANAADAPIDDATTDGWMKIAPYGTYPGSRPGRLQHFTQVEANAIVAEFRSLRGRAGRLFRGVPIYIGHPDQDPALYTDHRRLGKAIDLEARPDGLYGEVVWNALGEENQREGYWVYPSPRWDAPAGRPEFRPDRLISIGLTNTPRIATSEPVTNSEEVMGHGSSVMSEEEESASTNQPNLMDRKLLTDKLGLDVTATDEEIMAALTSLLDSAAAAQAKQTEADSATAALATEKTEKEGIACSLTAANAKIITLQSAVQASREAHANTLLDAAQADGRITGAERPAWLARLTGDTRESEANALAAIAPKLNTTPLDVTQSRVQIGDERGRRETIANAVETLMRDKRLSYHEAWALAKKDPALKPVWDAMVEKS